jgi:hypothetical protein
MVCTPLEEQPCTCQDGTDSTKKCSFDGARFGDCKCAPVVETPDCPGLKEGNPCTWFPDCGCKEGMHCVAVDAAGKTSCAVVGTKTLYASCADDADCPLNSSCLGSTCKAHCATAADCPGEGRRCAATYWNDAPTNEMYCSAGCIPTDASTCGSGATCVTYSDDAGPYAECTSAGNGVGPGTCGDSTNEECAVGYQCVYYTFGTVDSTTCSKECRVGHDDDCGGKGICHAWSDPNVIAGVEYGHCTIRCELTDPAATCGPHAMCDTIDGDKDTDCYSTNGTGKGVDKCKDSALECAPGYYCSSADDCIAWCKIDDAAACPDGGTCVVWTDGALVINSVKYGYCDTTP